MKFNIIISDLNFPEGPVFDFEGNLWFVEIKGGNLSRWKGTKLDRFAVDGTPNGFCDSGRGEIRTFNPSEKSFKSICSETIGGKRLIRPNDLIFDNSGNLLFSDHADGRQEPLSTICVLPKGETRAKIISRNKYFTNGLALMANTKTLVFAETYRQQLWIADWDPDTLQLKDERPFAKAGYGPWGPDGIAFDKEENLFVAIFNESLINVYDKQGNFSRSLDCPGTRPTSCAFDPSGHLGLVVTEAEMGRIISYPEIQNGLPII